MTHHYNGTKTIEVRNLEKVSCNMCGTSDTDDELFVSFHYQIDRWDDSPWEDFDLCRACLRNLTNQFVEKVGS